LYIVARLVEALPRTDHGRERTGGGSTFRIEIPLGRGGVRRPRRRAAELAVVEGRRQPAAQLRASESLRSDDRPSTRTPLRVDSMRSSGDTPRAMPEARDKRLTVLRVLAALIAVRSLGNLGKPLGTGSGAGVPGYLSPDR